MSRKLRFCTAGRVRIRGYRWVVGRERVVDERRFGRSQCCLILNEMITMGFAGENYLANYLLVATYVLVVEVAL